MWMWCECFLHVQYRSFRYIRHFSDFVWHFCAKIRLISNLPDCPIKVFHFEWQNYSEWIWRLSSLLPAQVQVNGSNTVLAPAIINIFLTPNVFKFDIWQNLFNTFFDNFGELEQTCDQQLKHWEEFLTNLNVHKLTNLLIC